MSWSRPVVDAAEETVEAFDGSKDVLEDCDEAFVSSSSISWSRPAADAAEETVEAFGGLKDVLEDGDDVFDVCSWFVEAGSLNLELFGEDLRLVLGFLSTCGASFDWHKGRALAGGVVFFFGVGVAAE